MSTNKSTIPLRIRYFAILLGMVFFFWLPFEDTSEIIPLLLACLFSAWIAAVYLSKTQKRFRAILPNYILVGTLAGIAITPLTILLMALKTGLHGHSTPDFPPQQIISVVQRTPIWGIGGLLIGLGRGIWLTNRQPDPQSSES